jgi:hypothetical protein
MPERPLIRLFLRRFAENDFVSSTADRREMWSVTGGAVAGASVFLSVLLAVKYQFDNFMPAGITSLRSLNDRFVFVSSSMLLLALTAIVQWDGLALDARDGVLLGILPVPRRSIIGAKLIAVGLLALAIDLAWNIPSTVLRPVSLPIKLPIGLRGIVTLTTAHAVVTLAAGAFGFLAIVAIREVLRAALGPKGFRYVSGALQAVLLTLVSVALLLLPASATNVARDWFDTPTGLTRSVPPIWFVAEHEALAGGVIDDLPHGRPRAFVRQEPGATALYRAVRPTFRAAGRVAGVALAVVIFLATTAAAWNSRRCAVGPTGIARRAGLLAAWRRVVTRMLVLSESQQAGFWFTIQTLTRSARQRTMLTSWSAVGLTLVVIAVRSLAASRYADVSAVPLSMLAASPMLLGCVLIGVRRTTQIAGDPRASLTFAMAWDGSSRQYLSGVKRAAGVSLSLPIVAGFAAWHLVTLGLRIATLHAMLGMAFALFVSELLFFRIRHVPFVSQPEHTGLLRDVASVVGFIVMGFAIAGLERHAFLDITAYTALLAALGAVTLGLWLFARARGDTAVSVELTLPEASITQRLDLRS